MRKRFVAIVVVMVLLTGITTTAFAHSAGPHWKELRSVLFGSKEYHGKTQEMEECCIVLERASSLCIDQFENNSSSYLNELRSKGVRGLPATISEITLYAGGTDHRKYTHLGWTATYKNDSKNPDWIDRWRMRQDILRYSVEHVFDFERPEQKEAFCRLLYYIHILCDHIEYKTEASYIIPIAGGHGQRTLVSELIDTLSVLFAEQKTDSGYMEMIRKLQTEEIYLTILLNQRSHISGKYMKMGNSAVENKIDDRQLMLLLSNPQDINSPELYGACYIRLAERILEIQKDHVPTLLKNESFFNKVFY